MIGVVGILVAANIAKAYSSTDDIIKEGLENCGDQMNNKYCIGVMHTLNNICEDSYYNSCFGDKWGPFMHHTEIESLTDGQPTIQ